MLVVLAEPAGETFATCQAGGCAGWEGAQLWPHLPLITWLLLLLHSLCWLALLTTAHHCHQLEQQPHMCVLLRASQPGCRNRLTVSSMSLAIHTAILLVTQHQLTPPAQEQTTQRTTRQLLQRHTYNTNQHVGRPAGVDGWLATVAGQALSRTCRQGSKADNNMLHGLSVC